MKPEQRDTRRDALIGGVAGLGAGTIGGTVMHPFETYTMAVQQAARDPKTPKPSYRYATAPFHKEMWAGVGHSALRKGMNYGLNLGIAFGITSLLKNMLDNRNKAKLTELGFKKT